MGIAPMQVRIVFIQCFKRGLGFHLCVAYPLYALNFLFESFKLYVANIFFSFLNIHHQPRPELHDLKNAILKLHWTCWYTRNDNTYLTQYFSHVWANITGYSDKEIQKGNFFQRLCLNTYITTYTQSKAWDWDCKLTSMLRRSQFHDYCLFRIN